MTASTRSELIVASLVLAACGGPGDLPPAYAGTSIATSSGGSSGAGSGGAGGSSASGSAGGGGGIGVGGAGGGPSVDGGAAIGARCNPAFVWTNFARVDSIPAKHFGQFGAITADELSIAWTASSGDVYVADRSKVTEPFGAPIKVNGAEVLARDRAALAPTGTGLVAVSADRGAFVGYDRTGVGPLGPRAPASNSRR
jgi:hypothetical protein